MDNAASPLSSPDDSRFPEVETLLPHTGEMVFLRRVCAHDDRSVECEVIPHAVHQQLVGTWGRERSAGVPVWIGIEYIAQAAAAYAALRADGEAMPGVVLGVRRFDCEKTFFDLNVPLRVRAELDAEAHPTALFKGFIYEGDVEVVRAKLHVHIGIPGGEL